MSVTIQLRPETEQRLAARAAQAGLTLEQYLQRLVEREDADRTDRAPTFDEMTGPFAKAVEAAGMTDEELADFFAETVDEARAEKDRRLPALLLGTI